MKKFRAPGRGVVSKQQVLREIKGFVDEDPGALYSIVIGTDSQSGISTVKRQCTFVTAIIVHRVGYGAKFYWFRKNINLVPVIRARIYQETMISLDFAKDFVPRLQSMLKGTKHDFEIHIDVGNAGPTREMIKEVSGMVIGNGFKFRTKPHSWGASSVADRFT